MKVIYVSEPPFWKSEPKAQEDQPDDGVVLSLSLVLVPHGRNRHHGWHIDYAMWTVSSFIFTF